MPDKTFTGYITRDYDRFVMVNINRGVEPQKRQDIKKLMQEKGYDPAIPMYCIKQNGKLLVYNGQHRLAIARELGLPVSYCIGDGRIGISDMHRTNRNWTLRDFASRFAKDSKCPTQKDYQELLEFCEGYRIPISVAVGILGGTSPSTVGDGRTGPVAKFKKGEFAIRDRALADRIIELYLGISDQFKAIRTRGFIAALYAACRIVPPIDDSRLKQTAAKNRELLAQYSTRDGYLEMLECIYNFNRSVSRQFPLKLEAIKALVERKRNSRKGETKAKLAARSSI